MGDYFNFDNHERDFDDYAFMAGAAIFAILTLAILIFIGRGILGIVLYHLGYL